MSLEKPNKFLKKESVHHQESVATVHNSKEDPLARRSAYSFEYYSQPVEQNAPEIWNTMVNGIKGQARVVGFLKEDGIVCWSDQARWHYHLVETALTEDEEKYDKIGAFFAVNNAGNLGTIIEVFSHQKDTAHVELLADYLDKNIIEQREKISLIAYTEGFQYKFNGPIDDYSTSKRNRQK